MIDPVPSIPLVNRFQRRKATRFGSGQPNLALKLRYLISSMAINAVQIWMNCAFSMVPTKVFTFRCCLRAFKNSSVC